MALPPSYVDESDYFKDSLNFLRDNDWLFRYSNIQILVEGLLERFDTEWQPVLENATNDELNEIPFGYNNVSTKTTLKNSYERVYFSGRLAGKFETVRRENRTVKTDFRNTTFRRNKRPSEGLR